MKTYHIPEKLVLVFEYEKEQVRFKMPRFYSGMVRISNRIDI